MAFSARCFCQFTYLPSISYTDSGTTTVLSMVGLAWSWATAVGQAIACHEKREVFGLILTLVGVVLIATNGDISSLACRCLALWGLLSAVGLASYNIIPVKLIGRYGSLVTMGFSMFVAGVSMCFIEQPWTVSVDVNTSEVILGMAAIIVVGTVIAAWIYMQAIADIGAVKASMMAAVEPVATIFTVTLAGRVSSSLTLLVLRASLPWCCL